LAEARRILVRDAGGVRVGVLAMAEHEFSIATADTPGANPLDVIDFVRNVAENRGRFDFLVVLLHGGPEFLTAPTPRLKDTCHFLVEMGAGAVVVQHPHAQGGYEHYRGGYIVYGQGALVMDEQIYSNLGSFHRGVVVALSVDRDGSSSMNLIPFVQSNPGPGARRMQTQQAEEFLGNLDARSRSILDDGFIREEWRRFCNKRKHSYMGTLLGHGRLVRWANRGGLLASVLYNKRRLLGTRNVVSCEAHREAIETILKEGLI
jgi:poly-gamma-glutamate synthesis protein (capsule biosynthesis protein)